jgi:SAM-dependent methyltransferase
LVGKHKCQFCDGLLEIFTEFESDGREHKVGRCISCNLSQLSSFAHIEESYYQHDFLKSFNMVGERKRQESWNKKRLERLQALCGDASQYSILDFGCGTGGFLEISQGHFKNLIGYDLSKSAVIEHQAAGWECTDSLDNLEIKVDIMTLFHVLEHVKEPWKLLSELILRFESLTYIVIEVPNSQEALLSVFENEAYKKNFYSAGHLWYFNVETLGAVAHRAGLEVVAPSHLQRYSIANQIGWLKDNVGGGQDRWDYLNDAKLNDRYEELLIENGAADSVFLVCKVV